MGGDFLQQGGQGGGVVSLNIIIMWGGGGGGGGVMTQFWGIFHPFPSPPSPLQVIIAQSPNV